MKPPFLFTNPITNTTSTCNNIYSALPTSHHSIPTRPVQSPHLSLSLEFVLSPSHLVAIDLHKMSMEMTSERVCYVQCNFCNTILAVSVPSGSLCTIVTVRCGHCANLLSVNMGALLQSAHLQDFQLQKQQPVVHCEAAVKDSGSSSRCNRFSPIQPNHEQSRMVPTRPPEKRQRVPSAYNRFIKDEIQRIKSSNPEISHREAFSTAAKNWAHFPHIHFGLKLDGNKQAKMDHHVPGDQGTQ